METEKEADSNTGRKITEADSDTAERQQRQTVIQAER